MTANTLHPDDPRLTAYALGELNPAERAEIERELNGRPELRTEVEQIQATAGLLARALEHEPVPGASVQSISARGADGQNAKRFRYAWIAATCASVAVAAAIVVILVPDLQISRQFAGTAELADSSRSMIAEEAAEPESRLAYTSSPTRAARLRQEFQNEPATMDYDFGSGMTGGAMPSSLTPDGRSGQPRPTQPSFHRPQYLPGRSSSEAGSRVAEGDVAQQRFYGPGDKPAAARPSALRPPTAVPTGAAFDDSYAQVPDQAGDVGRRDSAESPGGESYNAITENPFLPPVGEQALSTFSIDVDTASYSNVRRFLRHGQLPPRDAVRIEELVNYFDYHYPQPPDGMPFSITTEVAACPWEPAHRLVRIGLKGREIDPAQRPVSNLVFLIDVSGSMQPANRLPLVKAGLELLVEQLNENDRISIVTYAGNAGLVLDSTSGDEKEKILTAIRGLNAGGSTNGEAGIQLAYTQAIRNFTKNGSNRVVLCTDGDFNVGVSSDDELVAMIQEKARRSRVFLSIFGFGMGNLKDAKLEQLANKGNGHYAYIDDLREARKVFSEELMGTLYTIAKDVKIQVEFNPAQVGAYRLIGYENRALAPRDFADDTKDAGEIGAGHTVTALYEVGPADQVPASEALRLKYQKSEEKPAGGSPREARELLTVKLRYKLPDADTSVPLEFPLVDHPDASLRSSADFDWAAAVVAFGMVLRDSRYKGQADLTLVRELAQGSLGRQPSASRREFLELVDTAQTLLRSAAGGGNAGTNR